MRPLFALILLAIPLPTGDRPIVVEIPREVEESEVWDNRITVIVEKPEL